MKVIRLFSKISATSAPYNQFSKGFKSVKSINLPYFKDDSENKYFHYIPYTINVILSTIKNSEPVVIHTHNIYLLPVSIILKVFLKRKIIFTLHTSFHLLNLRNKILSISLFYYLDAIVCCSNSVYKSLPQYISKKNIFVIVNGIRSDLIYQIYQSSKLLVKSHKNFKIIQACRFVKGKNIDCGIDYVIKNNSIYNDKLKLDIYGDGPLLKKLMFIYKNNFISFHGAVPRDKLYKKISSSNAFISLSDGEGMPVAVLESIALGVPVILSDIPPHREVYEMFRDRVFIVKSYNEFINCIKKIKAKSFSMDINLIESLSIKKMEQQYLCIYEQ